MSDLGVTEWIPSAPLSSSATVTSLLGLIVTQLKGQEMNSTVAAMARRSPFTAAQWQELEHQELIFKYLTAGVPVPLELIIPIRQSFEALPAGRYFHQYPPPGHYSYHGKKPDPEPGRCRRTDGKKWRCSKKAHGESKYCERHMHRGRARSRNTVESRTSPASALLAPAGNSVNGGSSQMHNMDRGPFANRYSSEISAAARGLMPSQVSSFPTTKPVEPSILQVSYAQAQDLRQVTVCSLPRQQQQHLFFGSEQFNSSEPVKHPEHQPLRPFFDDWPKTRGSWSGFDGERSNNGSSFSTTQLSISIPMASSPGFSATSSRSTNEG